MRHRALPQQLHLPRPFAAGPVRERIRNRLEFLRQPHSGRNLIYFLSSTGTAFVLSPGRAFKLVAVNKLEAGDEWGNADHFAGSPLCDGKNLFIRSDNYMYCIGEAQGK